MDSLYLTQQARNAALIAAAMKLAETCGAVAAFTMSESARAECERAEAAQLQLDLKGH